MRYYYIYDHVDERINYASLSITPESNERLAKAGVELYDAQRGMPLSAKIDHLTFQFNPDEGDVLEDFMRDVGWVLVSDKMKAAIECIQKENLEFIPVSIINSKTQEVVSQSYYVLVVTRLTDCFQREKSLWFKTSSYISVTILAIDGNRLDGQHVLRVVEDPFRLVVSQKIYKKLRQEKLTGMSFGNVSVIYQ